MELFQRSESNKRRRESRSRSRPRSSQSTVSVDEDKTICMECRHPKEEDSGTCCEQCQETFHEECLPEGAYHERCGNIVICISDSDLSESESDNSDGQF